MPRRSHVSYHGPGTPAVIPMTPERSPPPQAAQAALDPQTLVAFQQFIQFQQMQSQMMSGQNLLVPKSQAAMQPPQVTPMTPMPSWPPSQPPEEFSAFAMQGSMPATMEVQQPEMMFSPGAAHPNVAPTTPEGGAPESSHDGSWDALTVNTSGQTAVEDADDL